VADVRQGAGNQKAMKADEAWDKLDVHGNEFFLSSRVGVFM
jgi:hypothetical protein